MVLRVDDQVKSRQCNHLGDLVQYELVFVAELLNHGHYVSDANEHLAVEGLTKEVADDDDCDAAADAE